MIGSVEDLNDEQRRALALVQNRFTAADRFHRQLRDKWNVFYGLYRNYRKAKAAHASETTSAGRRDVMHDFQKIMGKELFIPYTFATVETIIPRMLASNPQMLVRPNHPDAEKVTEAVKELYHRDQNRIKYSLKLQAVARTGSICGLGVQKTSLMQKYRNGRKTVPSVSGDGYVTQNEKRLVYAGPNAEWVDPYDFLWDPAAFDIDSANYVIHRTWRTDEYVAERVKTGDWFELDLEKVKAGATDGHRAEVWGDRLTAAGLAPMTDNASPLHEVWEYHDRENVYVVIDRALLVKASPNPHHHGDLPFQIYRPTPVPGEFCGIGEVEPMAHLQFELNTLRTNRSQAALLALNRGYFYDRSSGLTPELMVTGPNAMVPTFGDPRDAVFPMPIQDIPGSSVSEEQALKADIERTTGISDTTTGVNLPSAQATATSIQLVQAAANFRIGQKAKNVVDEVVAPGAEQWLFLYRQFLLDDEMLRVPDPDPEEPGVERWRWVKVGPEEVNADLEVLPADGSTEAENAVQKKADAMQLLQAVGPFVANNQVRPEPVIQHVLTEFDIKNPQDWIQPPQDPVAPVVEAVGQAMKQVGGMPEELIQQVLATANDTVFEQNQAQGAGNDMG